MVLAKFLPSLLTVRLYFFNALCYGGVGLGFYQIYHPLGLIVPAFLLWCELMMEAFYARTIQRSISKR